MMMMIIRLRSISFLIKKTDENLPVWQKYLFLTKFNNITRTFTASLEKIPLFTSMNK